MEYLSGNPEEATERLHRVLDLSTLNSVWTEILLVNYPPEILSKLDKEYRKKLLEFSPEFVIQTASLFSLNSSSDLTFGLMAQMVVDGIFEYDPNGDIEISLNGIIDSNFEFDQNMNVQPKQ